LGGSSEGIFPQNTGLGQRERSLRLKLITMGSKKNLFSHADRRASLEQRGVSLDRALDAKVVEEVFARNGARRLFALVMLAERLEQGGMEFKVSLGLAFGLQYLWIKTEEL
jgi:hypothetical protein